MEEKSPTEDIAREVTDKYSFPIVKSNDFGHNTPNTILPIGIQVKLDADKPSLEFLDTYLK